MILLLCHSRFHSLPLRLRHRRAWLALSALVLALGSNGIPPSNADDTPAIPSATAPESAPKTAAPTRVIDFDKLETTDNKVYEKVTVRKIEPDSLLIEHRNGIARISLFDLPIKIQKQYEFDPDEAIEHYKQREAAQRALRKEMLLRRVEHQAAEEAKTREENLEQLAKAQWIPVRAKIVAIKGENAMAYVDRLVMVPTRTKTALGGEGLPGPPKKEYVRISKNAVWLKGIKRTDKSSKIRVGKFWTGYIWPDGEVSLDAKSPENLTTSYRTLKPKE